MGQRLGLGAAELKAALRLALAMAVCVVPMAATAAIARAAESEPPASLFKFGFGYGSEPGGAGELQFGEAIQGDPATAHVVIGGFGDGMNRISEFTPWGTFVKAFGWDVAPGPVNEQQEVRIRAASGSFKLTFAGSTTPDLPFDASGAEVQNALNGLATIGGAGGTVEVETSSGSTDGAVPFVHVIAFKGALAASNVADLLVSDGSTPVDGGDPSTVLEARTRAHGTPGGVGLESCTVESGCKGAIAGSGTGQLGNVFGLAIDAIGAIYVRDSDNARVQKFSSSGEFVWMIGGDVNETKVEALAPEAQRNLCTAASGDVCQAGVAGPGNGQFAGGTSVEIGPGGVLYVTDSERIQMFDSAGVFLGDLPDPDGVLNGETPRRTAVDRDRGVLYLTRSGKDDVLMLDTTSGALLDTRTVSDPGALAVDPPGNLFAVEGTKTQRPEHPVKFDPDGNQLVPTVAEEEACAKLLEKAVGQCQLFARAESGLVLRGVGTGPAGNLYVANLQPGASHFIAAFGQGPVAFEAPPLAPPTIEVQFAATVTDTEAILQAEINPHFFSGGLGTTTYYLQYATEECVEAGDWEADCVVEQPAPPGQVLKSEVIEADVRTEPIVLSGLSPQTDYRYRFIAEGSGEPGVPIVGVGGKPGVEGADSAFRTYAPPPAPEQCAANEAFRKGASALLPDCRAYEMVSPVDKDGGEIHVLGETLFLLPAVVEQSTPEGDKLTYGSYRAFGSSESSPFTAQYIASRTAAGWVSEGISPPRTTQIFGPAASTDVEFRYFSEDLCEGWLRTYADPPLAAGAIEGLPNIYRRNLCPERGSYEAITTVEPSGLEGSRPQIEIQGAAGSGPTAKTIFTTNGKLTEAAPSSKEGQLLYGRDVNGIRYLCVLPGGTPSAGPCTAGGSVMASVNNLRVRLENAFSTDGSLLYFTDSNGLYLRQNPFGEGGECSGEAAPCTTKVADKGAQFWGAAEDGSRAIYSREGQLSEFRAASKTSTKIAGEVAGGVMGMSEDATRVYFASREDLDKTGPAQKGDPNLYLREAAGTPVVRFITVLAARDVNPTPLGKNTYSAIAVEPFQRAARVSPDGVHVAFMSFAPLTGYDNTDLASGEVDAEVFHYDANANEGEGRLVCVSCNPSGARPRGSDIAIELSFWAAARIPGATNNLRESGVLSDDGTRLYFESSDSLALGDTNGVTDVYQWQEAGSGSCEESSPTFSPAAAGCIDLISSGESKVGSRFVEATPDGSDVFFITLSSLLPQDFGLRDIYDARVEGGLPSPAPEAEECEGESCQRPTPAPVPQTPASSAYVGPGDFVEPKKPCPKGKVRRKGRCVKKQKGKAGKAGKRRGGSREQGGRK